MISLLALQLKNALYSREEHLKQAYQERWLSIPENIRNHIKTNVNKMSDFSEEEKNLWAFFSFSVSMLSERKQADLLKLLNVWAILHVQNYLEINGQI